MQSLSQDHSVALQGSDFALPVDGARYDLFRACLRRGRRSLLRDALFRPHSSQTLQHRQAKLRGADLAACGNQLRAYRQECGQSGRGRLRSRRIVQVELRLEIKGSIPLRYPLLRNEILHRLRHRCEDTSSRTPMLKSERGLPARHDHAPRMSAFIGSE
jgi:hypothetical protein